MFTIEDLFNFENIFIFYFFSFLAVIWTFTFTAHFVKILQRKKTIYDSIENVNVVKEYFNMDYKNIINELLVINDCECKAEFVEKNIYKNVKICSELCCKVVKCKNLDQLFITLLTFDRNYYDSESSSESDYEIESSSESDYDSESSYDVKYKKFSDETWSIFNFFKHFFYLNNYWCFDDFNEIENMVGVYDTELKRIREQCTKIFLFFIVQFSKILLFKLKTKYFVEYDSKQEYLAIKMLKNKKYDDFKYIKFRKLDEDYLYEVQYIKTILINYINECPLRNVFLQLFTSYDDTVVIKDDNFLIENKKCNTISETILDKYHLEYKDKRIWDKFDFYLKNKFYYIISLDNLTNLNEHISVYETIHITNEFKFKISTDIKVKRNGIDNEDFLLVKHSDGRVEKLDLNQIFSNYLNRHFKDYKDYRLIDKEINFYYYST